MEDSDLSDKAEDFSGVITFGDIKEHSMVGASVVFVSTYCLNIPLTFTVALRCPSGEEEERHIVFQNPCWEQFEGKYSAYTLRPHAFIHDSPLYHLEDETIIDVSLFQTDNRNEQGDFFSIDLNLESNREKSFIKTHRRENGELTFCPNNWWLNGLPERMLDDNEYFSFESCITGLGRTVRTFHFLTGNILSIYEIAKASTSSEDFIRNLEDLLSGSECSLFHFNKLSQFYNH